MKLVSTSLVFLLTTTSALAGQWKFSMSSDQKTCVASSEMDSNIGRSTDFNLEIKKSKSSFTELVIKVKGRRNDRTYQFDIPGKTTAAPFFRASSSGKEKTYKAIPMNTARFMKALSYGSVELKEPYPNNSKVIATVGNENFANVVNQMEKLCNNGQSLLDYSFEKILTSDTNRYLEMKDFRDTTLFDAIKLADDAFKTFSQEKDNQAKIDALVSQFRTELNLKDSLEREISDLDQRKIPQTINDQVKNNNRLANSQKELGEVNAALPGQKSAKDQAKSVLDKKEAAVAPLRAEHSQRLSAAKESQRDVDSLRSQLAGLQNDLSSAKARLSSLQNEKNRLYGQIDSDNYNLRDAQNDLNRANSEYRNYNEEREYRENLRRRGYHQALRDLDRARDYENRTQRIEDQARANDRAATQEKKNAQARLRTCQMNPPEGGCNKLAILVNEKVAASRAAESKLKEAKRVHRSAESSLFSARNRVTNIENEARRDAREITNRLLANVNEAQNRVDNLQSRINNAYSRINVIDNREIPSAKNQIASYERAIPNVKSNLRVAEPKAIKLENEYQAFKKKVQWDQKVAALDAAQRDFNNKESTYSSSLKRKASLESTIAFSQNEVSRLDAQLAAQKARSAQAKSELVTVKQKLEPYVAKRKDLDRAADQYKAELQNKSAQYTSMLNI